MSSETETKNKTKPAKAKNDESFAVIETGGKQYIVSVGDVLDVELLDEYNEGDTITFDKVLMSDDGSATTIGTPYIKGAKVTAKCLGLQKGKKLSIIRFKAKSNRSRKVGHRQKYSRVEITKIA